MPFDNITGRADAGPLIDEEVSREIIKGATEQSAALRLFRRVQMSSKTFRQPVLSALPQAYFVSGDTGLKQTTKMAWENKYLNVEEIATIVPIPENVLDDSDYDMWGEIRPAVEEAVALALDEAVFFGVDKPASWPSSIVDGARAKGKTVAWDPAARDVSVANDFNDLFGEVEEDGFDVSNVLARVGIRRSLRGARDDTGQSLVDVNTNSMYGAGIEYGLPGAWPDAAGVGTFGVHAIAGDFRQGIIGVRQDITVKLLDQAPITDNTGAVILNLAQQDAVALRVKARFAFEVANPINRENLDAATRHPFAILQTAGV